MNTIDILGLFAAFFTTFSFVPQVLKTLKSGKTEGISLIMYSFFVIGIAGWLTYGLFKQDLPVILANAVTFVLASVVLIFKVKNVLTRGEKA